jgi:hypothetical protein
VGRCISVSHRRAFATRYIVFCAFDNESTSEPQAQGAGVLLWHDSPGVGGGSSDDSGHEMNGQPLLILHGAPLHLRAQMQVGFTMVKYIRAIEVIEDNKSIVQGQRGRREDYQYSPRRRASDSQGLAVSEDYVFGHSITVVKFLFLAPEKRPSAIIATEIRACVDKPRAT